MDDGKELVVSGHETGVDQEKIEDIKRRILKAALERVTTDPSALSFEYYSAHNDQGKVYKGDIIATSLALSVPTTNPDQEGLAITLLSQTPQGEGETRNTLGYSLARAQHGLGNSTREIAITEMRRAKEGGVDNAVITRLHFADVGVDTPRGTINFGVNYKEDVKAKSFGSKLPSLWHRWRDGELQVAPTDHIAMRQTVSKNYPDEGDYERILNSLQKGVVDRRLTGKIARSEEYWSGAKSVSGVQQKETNRILSAIKSRIPLLK